MLISMFTRAQVVQDTTKCAHVWSVRHSYEGYEEECAPQEHQEEARWEFQEDSCTGDEEVEQNEVQAARAKKIQICFLERSCGIVVGPENEPRRTYSSASICWER